MSHAARHAAAHPQPSAGIGGDRAVVAPQSLWERNGVAGALRDVRDALGLGDLFEAISAQTAVVVICALVLFLINLAPMFGRGGTPTQSR